jgi:hypothetical protein
MLNVERAFDMVETRAALLGSTEVTAWSARESRSNNDAIEALEAAQQTVAAGQRELFAAIVRCERAGVWEEDGCRDLAQWLAGRLGISPRGMPRPISRSAGQEAIEKRRWSA